MIKRRLAGAKLSGVQTMCLEASAPYSFFQISFHYLKWTITSFPFEFSCLRVLSLSTILFSIPFLFQHFFWRSIIIFLCTRKNLRLYWSVCLFFSFCILAVYLSSLLVEYLFRFHAVCEITRSEYSSKGQSEAISPKRIFKRQT